ncbi:hypothetical protein ACJ73_01914 [Blastomyces percursus]|uniref:5'-deoxynucleotidase n=1 Tax=Blastomyces percursus TaxID=1658174 RepID=A0A1J9QF19_9EURO|nr:hypothetical protein ACJ73_01914 [Blastomyces percursus]
MEDTHSKDGSPLPFLYLMHNLKTTPRTGWLRTIKNPESVADHSFRLALLAMLAPEGVNRERCIFLALCHDMAESVVGDIPTYAGVPKEHKRKLEDSGFRYISNLLHFKPNLGQDIRDAWVEYENGETKEAQWVREMDKFECLVQAHEYEQMTYGRGDLEEFQGLSSKIKSPKAKEWLALLQQERQAHFSKLRQRIAVIFAIGSPSVVEKALLSEQLGFQQLFLDHILREKADDKTYLHADFLTNCLEEKAKVPTDLKIRLLGEKIDEGIAVGKKCSIVYGFPESMEELRGFEMKIQKPNYGLLLNFSGDGMQWCIDNERVSFLSATANELTDIKNHLKEDGYFKEINGDGSIEDVSDLVEKAVAEFVQHAEKGN